ncbi:MAG TPA: organomercurial lyase MerB [Thermoanaerobaculales bacterium]|nr:organomercurial lyase MerB [Thermoanaerobaculales bacterium]
MTDKTKSTVDLSGLFTHAESAARGEVPGLLRTIMILLMRGEPITLEEIGTSSRLALETVRESLKAWKDTEYDDEGRIVGLGLTLRPTEHRFLIEGRELYAWCALDTLIFPGILGVRAEVRSACHSTGTAIQFEVDPEGARRLDPESAVVSLVVPGDMASIRSSFCHQVHFFASHDAARPWLDEHAAGSVVSVAEAHRMGLALAKVRFAASTRCC